MRLTEWLQKQDTADRAVWAWVDAYLAAHDRAPRSYPLGRPAEQWTAMYAAHVARQKQGKLPL